MISLGHLSPSVAGIFARLERIGESQKDLAEAIGLEADKLSKIRSGLRMMKALELEKADEYLSRKERGAKRSNVLVASDQQPTRSASASDDVVEITALDISASMGPGTSIDDFVEAEPIKMDIGMLRSITSAPFSRLRMIKGVGDSMEPKIQSGDRILVDTTERTLARHDGIYWITIYGAHAIKRLRAIGRTRIQVRSDNPVLEPQDVDAEDITIEGRVIWLAREM